MFLTHLVILSFLDGAGSGASVDNASYEYLLPPWAFFDGFSEVGAAAANGGAANKWVLLARHRGIR
jgi:hypothetical protein